MTPHSAFVIGKHVVVTGGKGDLARAFAREFREAGYDVETPGRNSLDVCDPESIRDYFLSRETNLLICCAGLTHDSLIARLAPADWDRVWKINYLGAKQCAEAVLPSMVRQGNGHIVFLSSHAALHPPSGQVAYATAKRALLGLAQELATCHGPHNIRINTILPGFLDNRMTSRLSQERKDVVLSEHALGRLNTMDRAASFLRFLHESMPHTSGQWFQLDSRPMRD
jgi:3-oxoacyl-[acyl-carrier protein] reductase